VTVVEAICDLSIEIAAARLMKEDASLRTIGLVPTMGALHAGHMALIQQAREENDYVVVSIFVNPTQFGPNEDFDRYPRPFDKDAALCEAKGVDLIFHPSPEVMYPPGYRTYVEVTGMQNGLCGASRPGHFRGVATVVLKLFNIINPDRAYFGQKDAQQVRIIQQMVADLHRHEKVIVVRTVREPDGLAISSRNQYLDPEQRRNATVLWQALNEARAKIEAGERDAAVIQRLLTERIQTTRGAMLDYAAVVDANSLEPVAQVDGPTLLALAVKFGATRLIDNLLVRE
jgi:pantoate--beta-alanine ligase